MKKTIIDEILAPVDDFVETADLGKFNKTKLILALNAVRADMNSFFADAFDPDDDSYYDEAYVEQVEKWESGIFLADNDCPECGGSGKISVPLGMDDIEFEICSCVI